MVELEKRKFIVASHNPDQYQNISEFISAHVGRSAIIPAADGMEAQAKMANDPPHIIFINSELPKRSAIALTRWILKTKQFAQVSVIILAPIPDKEHFVDEVVLGRVQFVDERGDKSNLARALVRALNFSSNSGNQEFKLKFLAPGDVLLKEGEKGETVFIVKQGSMSAIINRDNGVLTLGKIEAGEFVGEMAYINGESRSADVIADTDCELIEIHMDQLDHMLFQKPAWARALMRTLSKRVKNGNISKSSVA